MPLNERETLELGELVEHMFDRLHVLECRVQKVRGALEGLEYWWVAHADAETIHSLPVRPSATQEGVGAERDLWLDHDGSPRPS